MGFQNVNKAFVYITDCNPSLTLQVSEKRVGFYMKIYATFCVSVLWKDYGGRSGLKTQLTICMISKPSIQARKNLLLQLERGS